MISHKCEPGNRGSDVHGKKLDFRVGGGGGIVGGVIQSQQGSV